MTTQSLPQPKTRHNRIDIVEVDFTRRRVIIARPGIVPAIYHRLTVASWRRVIKTVDKMTYTGQCIVRPCATGFLARREVA